MRSVRSRASLTMSLWRSSNYLLGSLGRFGGPGELEVNVLERRLADREVAEVDIVVDRPGRDPLCRHHRLLRQHQHAITLERALLARNVGKIAERPLGRQREADLGRPQVAPAELLGPPQRDDLA